MRIRGPDLAETPSTRTATNAAPIGSSGGAAFRTPGPQRCGDRVDRPVSQCNWSWRDSRRPLMTERCSIAGNCQRCTIGRMPPGARLEGSCLRTRRTSTRSTASRRASAPGASSTSRSRTSRWITSCRARREARTDHLENLQLLCNYCNSSKGTMD